MQLVCYFVLNQETAASNGVTAMPTFIFFRNKAKIDTMRGADPGVLEEKIKKWYGSGDDADDDTLVKGHVSCFFMKDASFQTIRSFQKTVLLALIFFFDWPSQL
jgi:hypothetical protein